MEQTGWTVIETQFVSTAPQGNAFTLGNSYLGTRGTFEEGYPDAAQLLSSVYDDVAGTPNWSTADWLPLVLVVAGERSSGSGSGTELPTLLRPALFGFV